MTVYQAAAISGSHPQFAGDNQTEAKDIIVEELEVLEILILN